MQRRLVRPRVSWTWQLWWVNRRAKACTYSSTRITRTDLKKRSRSCAMCSLLTGVGRGRATAGTNSTEEGNSMEAVGLLVTLEARAGKEADAEAFLRSAQPLALNEKATLKWYAI